MVIAYARREQWVKAAVEVRAAEKEVILTGRVELAIYRAGAEETTRHRRSRHILAIGQIQFSRERIVLFMIEPISPSVDREIPAMAIPLTQRLLNGLFTNATMPSKKPMPEIGNPTIGISQANSAIIPIITDAMATFPPRLCT